MESVAVNLLIDLIGSEQSRPLDPLRDEELQCLVDLLFAAMWSDGDASDEEYEEIAAMLAATPWFEHVNPTVLERMFDRATAAAGTLSGLGTDDARHAFVRARAAHLATAHLREVTYRMAVSVTLADNVIHPQEQAFLSLLAAALEIPDERAERLSHPS